jgi:DNA-binding PadR family transcriptional regulator
VSRRRATRSDLVRAIGEAARRGSTRTVLFHAAIAERLGLNPSDHKCADILTSEAEPCTPGRLADLTGLTTGAVTGVLDRLERAGFIAREADPHDRRRVLVRFTPERMPDIGAFFIPVARGLERLCAKYNTDELGLILEFMNGCTDIIEEARSRLRESSQNDSTALRERGSA